MLITKKINHNALLAVEDGVEIIAMGKGIGFAAQVNTQYIPSKADKIFVLDTKEKRRNFAQLVSEIPLDVIVFTEELIRYIKSSLGKPIDSNIYITLTDHINYAIKRQNENKQIVAIMLPEMKLLYPSEYTVSEKVVEKINKRFKTYLGDNEVGFILMHILNSLSGEENSANNLKILEISKFIIDTVNLNCGKRMNQESIKFNRFLVHIKFLAKRIVYRETLDQKPMEFLEPKFRKGDDYKIATVIADKLEQQYGVKLQRNEIDYLAVHLITILQEEGG